MGYSEIIRATVTHEYFGKTAPPVTIRALDPQDFGRQGMLLRQTVAGVVVLADDDVEEAPKTVSLVVQPTDIFVNSVTFGALWTVMPQLSLPLGETEIALDETAKRIAPNATILAPQTRPPALAAVHIACDPNGTRVVQVKFQAVAAHWAYHVTGNNIEADLAVTDPEGHIQFEDLGTRPLQNGVPAKVLRSRQALPARARPTHRFSLQKPGPFGPVTLIPVLPGAGPRFVPIPGADVKERLQSDIYVSVS